MTVAAEAVKTIVPARSGISPWKSFATKPEDWFDKDEIAAARAYQLPKRRVHVVQRTINVVLDLVIIRTHAMPNMVRHLGFHNWVLDIVAISVVLALVGIVTNIGFSWWEKMIYDKRAGFSTMTPATFWGDLLKEDLGYGLALGIALSLLLWWIIRATDAWWLIGFAVVTFVAVGFGLLYPKLIAPMFNKFKPLEDEELHADLLDLAHSVGADIEKVEVADASKRDTRDNAYVAGAGKTRRMVLHDTILDRPHDQLRFVSAHEIGHWRLKHVWRIVPTIVALQFLSFGFVKLVLTNDSILRFAGVKAVGDPAALPLFFFVFALPGIVTGMVVSYMSRVSEREADLFALEAVEDPAAATAMMRNMSIDNKAELVPSLWKRLNGSHPPVAERLAMFREWDQRRTVRP